MSKNLVKQSNDREIKRAENGLIIFLRVAEAGKVKTRLAKTAGKSVALQIYQKLVKITLDQARHLNCTTYLYFYPTIDQSFNDENKDFIFRKQYGEDLGQKMKIAFDQVLENHEKAVIIGTDCPYINTEIITDAFEKLDKYDVTLGPATDGGYYLLGLTKNHSQLFSGVEWSTPMVLPKTIENINLLQWSVVLLPTLSDVDYEDDWIKYLNESQL
ncbi:MAG: TIGR04282 family arsenosugar biosynthesis glycosyltransferase [Saprospiraceae bacterium]|nr:TIGR04282 family arsenosugar biosynthesis glycosyltransferase [Saprospiraceae bacterium]